MNQIDAHPNRADAGSNPAGRGPNPADRSPSPADRSPKPADRGPNPADGGTNPAGGSPKPADGGARLPEAEPRAVRHPVPEDSELRPPRLGLGGDRVAPDRVRFAAVPELLLYLCDHLRLDQTELAERCRLRPEQLSRWFTGAREPRLASLRAALEPLGWRPVLGLAPTDEALNAAFDRPRILADLIGNRLIDLLVTAAIGADDGIDLVVGGEVAAVLQGVPLRTRHMVLHLRGEHLPRLRALGRRRHQWVRPAMADRAARLNCGGDFALLCTGTVRPATRLLRPAEVSFQGLALPVVDLAALLADDPGEPAGLGPGARAAAGRFGRHEGAD